MVKKCVSGFLSMVILLIFCSGAYADAVDIENLSDAELLEYNITVGKEMAKRGLGTVLPGGEYLVGRDIAAGQYRIKRFEFPDHGYSVYISVYKSAELKEQYLIDFANNRQAQEDAQRKIELIQNGESDEKIEDIVVPPDLNDANYKVIINKTLDGNDEISITLEEGQVLTVQQSVNVVLIIEKATGLFME